MLHSWLSCTIGQFSEAGILGKIVTRDEQSTTIPTISTQDIPPTEYSFPLDIKLPSDTNVDIERKSVFDTPRIDNSGKNVEEIEIVAESSTTASSPAGKALGRTFVDWLRMSIIEEQIGFNNTSSHLHVVKEGLFLASPAIFRRYLKKHPQLDGDVNIQSVQRGFFGLALHKTKSNGSNIWTYRVRKDHHSNTRKIHGIVIRDPLQKLSLDYLPKVNSLLELETL